MSLRILVLLFVCTHWLGQLSAQKRVLANLDENPLPSNSYIDNYTTEQFLSSSLADQELDPFDVDLELLKATLFFLINKKRGSRTSNFNYSPILSLVVFNYLKTYGARNFRSDRNNKRKIERMISNVTKQLRYQGFATPVFVDLAYTLDYDDRKRYMWQEEEQQFYYRRTKKDAPLVSIPRYTYRSFAEQHLRRMQKQQFANKVLRDKAYTDLGCHVQLYWKRKHRIPQIKIMWMTGARRLALFDQSQQ